MRKRALRSHKPGNASFGHELASPPEPSNAFDHNATEKSLPLQSKHLAYNPPSDLRNQSPGIDDYSACIAAVATAPLYRIPVTACQNGSGSICSALIGTTMVSPGSICTPLRLNHRLPSRSAITLPSARTTYTLYFVRLGRETAAQTDVVILDKSVNRAEFSGGPIT